MGKKYPHVENIEDSKAINISLMSGLFVVIILTVVDLVGNSLRKIIPEFNSWYQNLVVLIICMFFIYLIAKDHRYLLTIENYLWSKEKK